MTIVADARRILWLGASASAGLVVGQLVVCPGEFWRGIFILGFVPGVSQSLLLWRSRPVLLVRWLALTQLGVLTTYVFTIAAFLLVAWLASPFIEPSEGGSSPLVGWLLFAAAFFIGGAGLGGLQVTGFPRQQRRARWVLATMLGSIAVGPIAIPLIGLGACDGTLGAPHQLVGLVGGSLYGLMTAIALPPNRA